MIIIKIEFSDCNDMAQFCSPISFFWCSNNTQKFASWVRQRYRFYVCWVCSEDCKNVPTWLVEAGRTCISSDHQAEVFPCQSVGMGAALWNAPPMPFCPWGSQRVGHSLATEELQWLKFTAVKWKNTSKYKEENLHNFPDAKLILGWCKSNSSFAILRAPQKSGGSLSSCHHCSWWTLPSGWQRHLSIHLHVSGLLNVLQTWGLGLPMGVYPESACTLPVRLDMGLHWRLDEWHLDEWCLGEWCLLNFAVWYWNTFLNKCGYASF